MKKPVSPHVVASLILGLLAPLSAQNLPSSLNLSDSSLKADGIHRSAIRLTGNDILPGTYEVPALERAESDLANDQTVFIPQDAATLADRAPSPARDLESVVDLDILRNPSPYRRVLVSASNQPGEVATDNLQTGLARISAVYRESGKPEKSSDCQAISLSVEQRVSLDPSNVLEVVELEVTANPGCSCEIVKAAIKSSEADVDQVVAIVETAIIASPESMRIVSQCAIAAMPESITAVQALLARLDPNSGDTSYSSKGAKSAKDSKGAKVASIIAPPLPNPLDRPNYGPPIPPIPPFPVTNVNPGHCF
jgi:hypothetical protein